MDNYFGLHKVDFDMKKKISITVDIFIKISVVLIFGLFFYLKRMLFNSEMVGNRALIITPPGGGNIGDEALVYITLHKFRDYHLDVCVSGRECFMEGVLCENSTVYEVPKLVYGNSIGFLNALLKIRDVFFKASHIVIIGADIIDGAYNERASFTRIWLAILGKLIGLDVRILGFSLNSKPKASCYYSLRLAQKVGVLLLLRDPVSHARAVSFGLNRAKACADVVFCDDRKESFPLASNIDKNSFAIINVSGLIFKDERSVNGLIEIANYIVQKGLKIVLLPHVSRVGADDIIVCDKLFEKLSQHHENILYIRKLLSPKQVRYLCERSTFVLSGRMHLGVMALSQKKCAFIFSSQGKVEGLLKMFEMPLFEIDNSTSYCDRIINLIDEVLAGKVSVTDESLDKVLQLAEENFVGI